MSGGDPVAVRVSEACDEEDGARVLDALERVLTTAGIDACKAVAEAYAGFPVSGGSVARWTQRRFGVNAAGRDRAPRVTAPARGLRALESQDLPGRRWPGADEPAPTI